MKLNLENFSDILVAAEYLLCTELSDYVRKWIFSTVDMPENIVTLLKFSQGYMIWDLEKQAYNFLTSNITAVNTQELQMMSFDELLALLSSNDISCSEEELWFTVIKLAQKINNENETFLLFDCVRFARALPLMHSSSPWPRFSFGALPTGSIT